MLKDKERQFCQKSVFSVTFPFCSHSIIPLTSNSYFCDIQKPPVTVKVEELTTNWFQSLSVSLHLLACRRSQGVCVSERAWKTLWIYVILQAIRLSRALLNMTWSVPAPEQTLLSPWPARAVNSWSSSWDLTAVAFPKQISAAFGNAARPHNLGPAPKKTSAGMLRLIHFWAYVCCVTLCVFTYAGSLCFPPTSLSAPVSLCFLMLFSLLLTRSSSGSL